MKIQGFSKPNEFSNGQRELSKLKKKLAKKTKRNRKEQSKSRVKNRR